MLIPLLLLIALLNTTASAVDQAPPILTIFSTPTATPTPPITPGPPPSPTLVLTLSVTWSLSPGRRTASPTFTKSNGTGNIFPWPRRHSLTVIRPVLRSGGGRTLKVDRRIILSRKVRRRFLNHTNQRTIHSRNDKTGSVSNSKKRRLPKKC